MVRFSSLSDAPSHLFCEGTTFWRGTVGYTAFLPENVGAQNPTVKIKRVLAKPDPSKVREFADDVRDGKFSLPIGRRMPLRDAAEAHVLGEKGGIGKIQILLLAPDSAR
jgi:NADPH:quinone reductase-like Zn-dependent oxidoreductase